jgi:transcriptional regulator with XRE-family HTH domain
MRYKLEEVWRNWERMHWEEIGGKRLGIRELAAKSQVNVSVIQRVQNNQNVTIETLERLARFFGVRIADLLDED